MADEERPIIKKVVKKVVGGAHGGAWKVAYADFTTAMMAFFMLLWLLNVTEQETLEGLADYFAPTLVSMRNSAGGKGPMGGETPAKTGAQSGGTTLQRDQAESNPDQRNSDADFQNPAGTPEAVPNYDSTINDFQDRAFRGAEEKIKQAIQKAPELSDYKDQVQIEITRDGMKIQLMDKDQRPMFRDGTAENYGYAQRLISEISRAIETLPNNISVEGHTDAGFFERLDGNYTKWELSSDRANVARRIMEQSGIVPGRIAEIVGKSDTEPLFPDQRMRPENRRITILVMRENPSLPPGR